jgi:prevent-host-death family protein
MQSWPLEEARKHIADLVNTAIAEGPQRVTRHGKGAVVVVSEDEWQRVTKTIPSFGRLLAAYPAAAKDVPRRRPARALKKQQFA